MKAVVKASTLVACFSQRGCVSTVMLVLVITRLNGIDDQMRRGLDQQTRVAIGIQRVHNLVAL